MLRTRVYTGHQTLLLRSRVCWAISALRAGNSNRFNTSGRGVMLIINHSQNLAVASRGFDFDICSDHPARVSTIPNDFVGHRLAEYSLQL